MLIRSLVISIRYVDLKDEISKIQKGYESWGACS